MDDAAWSFVWRLLAFHGLVTLAVAALVILEPVGDWSNLLLGAVITSHGSLLGIWIAMGTRSTPWWLLGTALALVACAGAVKAVLPGLPAETCPEALLIQMVITCPMLLALRLAGYSIREPAAPHKKADPSDRQFSLRSMFGWTAVVAILLSLLKMFPMTLFSDNGVKPLRSDVALLLLLAGNGLIALVVIWGVFGQGRTARRMTALTAIATLPSLIPLAGLPWRERAMFFAVYTFIIAGSLTMFRWAGYGLRDGG